MDLDLDGVKTSFCTGANNIPKSVRYKKGKSLIEALSDYTVVDLETTGLDPRWDSLIELAALKVESGKIVDRFQSLVNPGFEIDGFITDITGITNDMLSDAPPLSDVFGSFLKFIGNDVVVAHNANFDINFIYDNCSSLLRNDFTNNFVDTMRVSRRLFKNEAHHRLCDLVERFGIDGDVEHRAMSDAMQTFQCYEYIKRYSEANDIDISSLYPNKGKTLKAEDIKTSATVFDKGTAVYSKTFVFTGTLERMPRKGAMQIVVDMGGLCADSVTKSVNYLVMGNTDYSKVKDGKSAKQKKAEQLYLAGIDIETISENIFYEMIAESAVSE